MKTFYANELVSFRWKNIQKHHKFFNQIEIGTKDKHFVVGQFLFPGKDSKCDVDLNFC